MKRLLQLFIIILISVPLFAQVTMPDSIPEPYRDMLENSLEANTRGRGMSAAVEAFSLDEETGVVSLTILVGAKEFLTTVPKEALEEEIRNILFYEESLFLEGEVLDYIQGPIFSFCPEDSFRKGTVFRLLDSDDSLRGVFLVEKVYEEGVILRPQYLDNPLPGLRLVRSMPLRTEVLVGASLDFSHLTAEAKLVYSSFLYPIQPTLSLVFETGKATTVGVGLGFLTDFSLGSLWPESVGILRNTSLVGSVEMIVGTDLSGRYTLGIENSLDGKHSVGVSFVSFDLGSFGIALTGGLAL